MRRTLCMLLIAVLICCVFSGCHGTVAQSTFQIPEQFDTNRNYEITFWAKNDTNMNQVAVYHQAIADFEALYPNIKVNLRLYTDYGKIYNDVITNISTNTTPNVCISYPDHIATYLTGSQTVVPLDGLMGDARYGLSGSELRYQAPGQIVPEFLEECTIGSEHYAIPFMRSTEVCYVNKTYVEALGYTLPEVLTWDFVWEVSEAATAKDADGNFLVNGQKVLLPFIYKSTDNMMITSLQQLGAEYSSPAGESLMFHDTTKSLLEEVAEHSGSGAFSTFKISGYPANFLNAGQCIFAIDSTAGATWMGSEAPLIDISEDKLVEFEIEVMTVPQYDTQQPKMISQGPSVCVFNKDDSQEVLASWLFAQFLLTESVQVGYAQTEGYLPVTTQVQNSQVYQDYLSRSGEDNDLHYWVKIAASRLLQENIENTFVTPVFNGSASLRDAAGHLIESVTKSVRRNQTVDDAYLEKLFADTQSLYRLDQRGTSSAKAELGPLPQTAVLLLGAMAVSWVIMAVYVIAERVKKKKSVKFSGND